MESADNNQSEYERGLAAGQVLSRLDSHDDHLAKINGSMGRVADELEKLRQLNQDLLMGIQRLGDAADSDRATVVTTATALEKAESARRDKSVSRWTPFERLIGIAFSIAALIGVLTYLILHFHFH
jgi:hypothetical protein